MPETFLENLDVEAQIKLLKKTPIVLAVWDKGEAGPQEPVLSTVADACLDHETDFVAGCDITEVTEDQDGDAINPNTIYVPDAAGEGYINIGATALDGLLFINYDEMQNWNDAEGDPYRDDVNWATFVPAAGFAKTISEYHRVCEEFKITKFAELQAEYKTAKFVLNYASEYFNDKLTDLQSDLHIN